MGIYMINIPAAMMIFCLGLVIGTGIFFYIEEFLRDYYQAQISKDWKYSDDDIDISPACDNDSRDV